MRIFRYKRVFWILAAPAAYYLTKLASKFPAETEHIYSAGIYPIISGFFGRLTGFLPFSLAEIMIFLIAVSVAAYLIYQTAALIKKADRKTRALRIVLNLLVFASIWYGSFVILCGLNYHRLSFTQFSGLTVRNSSAEELAALCGELVEKANALRSQVSADENGLMSLSFESDYRAAKFAGEAFRKLGSHHSVLAGYVPRPKPVIVSRLMSMLNITGIYIPFTFEANVNTNILDYAIPSTMMHELAHYKGFMREDEANFISYLACSASGNTDFEYSGVLLALAHSSNALYSANRELYYEAMEPLADAVWADWNANNAYWKQFEGPVAEVSTAVNDTYLRANSQSDGVKSYGRMVDLLLADYRLRNGLNAS